MLVFFVYDADSCTIFNQENASSPGYFRTELGRVIVDLDPLHLSRELRWVKRRLKRLGYHNPKTHKRVCELIAHGLRAKEHIETNF